MERDSAGQVIAGSGDLELGARRAQWNQVLNAELAEGPLADDGSSMVVSNRTGYDFRSAGAAAIHEHDERDTGVGSVSRGGEDLVFLAPAALRADHGVAVIEKQRRHLECGIQQTAGVPAQIENQPFQAAALQPAHGVYEVFGCVALKVRNADVSDAVFLVEPVVPAFIRVSTPPLHRLDFDLGANEREVDHLVVPTDCQSHASVLGAGDRLDHLAEGKPFEARPIHVGDDVARLDARVKGRRVVQRGDDLDLSQSILDDRDAHPDEVPTGVFFKLLGFLGPDHGGKVVERLQRPAHQLADDDLLRQANGLLVDVFHDAPKVPNGGAAIKRWRRSDLLQSGSQAGLEVLAVYVVSQPLEALLRGFGIRQQEKLFEPAFGRPFEIGRLDVIHPDILQRLLGILPLNALDPFIPMTILVEDAFQAYVRGCLAFELFIAWLAFKEGGQLGVKAPGVAPFVFPSVLLGLGQGVIDQVLHPIRCEQRFAVVGDVRRTQNPT